MTAKREEIDWLHRFINCTPFGPDAPVKDIQRAHKIVEGLTARIEALEAERAGPDASGRSLSEKRIKELAGEACVLDGIGAAPYKKVVMAIQKSLAEARALMFQPDWANFQQGRKDGFADGREVTDELVQRFLQWPVPASVYPDGIPGKSGRTGTNLLSAIEARSMLEYVLQGATPTKEAERSGWVMVPREPSDAMIEEMYAAWADGEFLAGGMRHFLRHYYTAMLAAAPAAPEVAHDPN